MSEFFNDVKQERQSRKNMQARQKHAASNLKSRDIGI